MLHQIVTEHPNREFHPCGHFTMTTDVLVGILDALDEFGYDIVSLDEAVSRLQSIQDGNRFACLTFDDGYRSNFEIAYPIFKERGVPMATYATTGFIDRTDPVWWYGLEECILGIDSIDLRIGDHRIQLPTKTLVQKNHAFDAIGWVFQRASRQDRNACFAAILDRYGIDIAAISDQLALTWDELVEFDQQPGVTIGAHTVSHPALSSLTDAEMHYEIATSRQQLEDPTTTGPREFTACHELGFTTATPTRHNVLSASDSDFLCQLPRLPTDRFETKQTIAVKLSGLPGVLQAWRQRLRTQASKAQEIWHADAG